MDSLALITSGTYCPCLQPLVNALRAEGVTTAQRFGGNGLLCADDTWVFGT